MTVLQSATPAAPRRRDLLDAARCHLSNRWALFALGGLAIGIGMYFGGWGWLVAAGAAPVILSVLPCLVMCGLGACMMCRSGKKATALQTGAVETAAAAAAPGTGDTGTSTVAGSSCRHDDVRGNSANAVAK